MFKKIKALWHAIVAVLVIVIVTILLTVAVPLFIGLVAIAFTALVGYWVYQASQEG